MRQQLSLPTIYYKQCFLKCNIQCRIHLKLFLHAKDNLLRYKLQKNKEKVIV